MVWTMSNHTFQILEKNEATFKETLLQAAARVASHLNDGSMCQAQPNTKRKRYLLSQRCHGPK